METNAAMKFVVPKGWSVTEEVMPDGSREFTIKPGTAPLIKRVPASQLSLNDDFIKYLPKTGRERKFKEEVIKVITVGVSDFWRPVCDPSFVDYDRICYMRGKMPAVDKNYNWWLKISKEFCPEYGSRIGTKSEYIAFQAVLIKDLVASGKSMEWAWDAVCNDSKELGHYRNSAHSKPGFEPTGSREVCGWYDLANCYKLLGEDEESGGFWLVGGGYDDDSIDCPLADLCLVYDRNGDDSCGCGWLVFDRYPD